MTRSATDSLGSLLFGDLPQELANTRRLLERVPDEHLGWRPHERSMTLGGLATHVANLPLWPWMILNEDGFDLAAPFPRPEPLASRKAILASFDERAEALRARLASTADADLLGGWVLRHGDQVMVDTTRAAAVRTFGISHIIHHRAQLTVFLRLLDTPVPGMYGPSADEEGGSSRFSLVPRVRAAPRPDG